MRNGPARPGGSRGQVVQETVHGGDPSVCRDGHDVEADHERLGPGRSEAPLKAAHVVVYVDVPELPEFHPGELLPCPGDQVAQPVGAADVGERVNVARVGSTASIAALRAAGSVSFHAAR